MKDTGSGRAFRGGQRRTLLTAAAATAAAAGLSALARPVLAASDAYPSKTIRVLVPYGAGGSADNAARFYAERLAAALGQPVVIDNRPGAAGTLAAGMLANAPVDGYTLMVAPTAVVAITPAARKTSYDPVKDFTSIGKLTTSYGMMSMTQALPAKTLPEFIELARKNPGKYAFGSSGVGTITHLTGEVFQQAVGIELLHVPYKTIVEGVGDLFDGRIALVFDPFILPQVRTGKVKPVAALGGRRHPDFPDVPMIEELGIDMQGVSQRSWFGIFGPAGLPSDVVARLDLALARIASDPQLATKLLTVGQAPDFMPSAQFTEKVANDLAYFRESMSRLGIKLDN